MDTRTEPIRQDIDQIRESMTDKMGQIESKIKGTVEDTTETLKRGLDVKYQVGEHPWAAMGAALLAGYALGSMGGSSSSSSPATYRYRDDFRHSDFRAAEPMRYYGGNGQSADWQSSQHNGDWRPNQPASQPSGAQQGDTRQSSSFNSGYTPQGAQQQSSDSSFLNDVMGQLGGELDTLKTAAISSLIGLLRDTVKQNLPGVYQEAERLRQGPQSASSGAYTAASNPANSSGESAYPSRANYGTASGSTYPSSGSTSYRPESGTSSSQTGVGSGEGEFYREADITEGGRAPTYQRTPEIYPAGSSQQDQTKLSTQRDVGRNPNYDFIPPSSHGEPDGRP